jgi:hypothetical protein
VLALAGIGGPAPIRLFAEYNDLFTVTVNAEGINEPSEQSWVKALAIGRRLYSAERR